MAFHYGLKFTKDHQLKYISHLDILRLFQRAFKRADIGLRHSEGFNPHPKMSFAQPLSLGFTSEGEYLEFETVAEWNGEDLIRTLNAVLPPGTEVTSCGRLPEVGRKSLASLIEAADYEITLEVPMGEMLAERADLFMSQEAILVEKKRKKDKNPTMVDIKPMVVSLDAKEEDCILTMNVRLKTGSNANLNPELLVTAFLNFTNIPFRRENLQIRRKEMYYLEDEAYKPLLAYLA